MNSLLLPTIKAVDDAATDSVSLMSSTSFSNTSLPFISSVLPSTTASNVFVATVIVGLITVYIVHYSPARLTGVLLASLYDAEKLYHDAIEAGVFSGSDTSNEQIGATLLRLQREVSQTQTHETTLRNSLSTWKMVRDMLKGRSFTVYRCINEVKRFKTQVEILKESRLRSANTGAETWGFYLRRRRTYLTSV